MSRGSRAKATPTKRPGGQAVSEVKDYSAIVAILAALGLAVTIYLLYLQYSGITGAFCPEGGGCDIVRASRYSKILGVPVSLIGVAGYAAILLLALWHLPPAIKRLYLYYFTLAGFTFSLYLTYLELFVIKAVCLYCVVSAVLITGILVTLLIQRPLALDLSSKRLATLSGLVVAVVLAGSILTSVSLASQEAEGGFREGLARHLTATGAVMYGAWWCPHCADQKQLFGEAFQYVNYVECDPRGENPNPHLCQEKEIKGYPTWEIGGRLYPGMLSLEVLVQLSGYER